MARSPQPPPARDPQLYRPNVGIAVFNKKGGLFLGRRISAGFESGPYEWQMPQGGIDGDESPPEAALRELQEETGIDAALVTILEEAPDWIFYDFPPDVVARLTRRDRRFIGQRQKWFALRFLGADSDIKLDRHKPEFGAWRWGTLEEAPNIVIPFKRAVYQEVAHRFARFGVAA